MTREEKAFIVRTEPGCYDVLDGRGGRYMGLIRYVKRGRWYWNTRRGEDGFAAGKDAAQAIVFNTMRKSVTKENA